MQIIFFLDNEIFRKKVFNAIENPFFWSFGEKFPLFGENFTAIEDFYSVRKYFSCWTIGKSRLLKMTKIFENYYFF